MNNLEYYSALDIGELVNKKIVSPTEVLEYFEKRIKKINPKINAFVYTKFDEAYEKAKILEKRLEKGENCGVFAGVPFALKDFLPSKKGWLRSYGGVKCLVQEDDHNSLFCEVMEREGGIAIGKTNAPTYGFRATTDNKMYGPTSTPFNLAYNSGGSSGGSAAAVAAGLVPIAEGGDAGGSIRVPAACCNLFGFKASVGSIPNVNYPDAWCATHPFCMGGGLTKTVEDARALFLLMSSYNPYDPFSIPRRMYLGSNRIAYTSDFGLFEVDPKVEKIVRKAAMRLKNQGYQVDEVKFNFKYDLKKYSEMWCKGITIDCALELNQKPEILRDHSEDFPEEFLYWKKECDKLNINDMYEYNLVRTDILYQFEKVFGNYDFIISPTMCCLPILNAADKNTKGPLQINGKEIDPLAGWAETFIVNFVGYPAASIPAGFYNDLPIGMHIVGKKYRDDLLLDLARDIEIHYPWKDHYKKSYNI